LRWLFDKSSDDHDWKNHFLKYHALREELAHKREAGEFIIKSEVQFGLGRLFDDPC